MHLEPAYDRSRANHALPPKGVVGGFDPTHAAYLTRVRLPFFQVIYFLDVYEALDGVTCELGENYDEAMGDVEGKSYDKYYISHFLLRTLFFLN